MATGNELSVGTKGLTLSTLGDALAFGKLVADSHFAPKDFRGKPHDCVLAIQHGAEIGLSPMQSLQSIAVVNGRPSIYGDAAKAICVGAPVCEFIHEEITGDGDAMTATCTAKRRGHPQPVVSSFSVADARKAKLWGKAGPWTEYPRRMLQLRARGFALRDAFPDVLRGLITSEEAADYPVPVEPAPPKATKATAKPVPRLDHKPAASASDFLADEIAGWPEEVKAVCRETMRLCKAAGGTKEEALQQAHAAGLKELEGMKAEAAAAEGE